MLRSGTRVVHPSWGNGTIDKVMADYSDVLFDRDAKHGRMGLRVVSTRDLRRQTLFEYCTQRTGFGRTSWGAFAVRFGGAVFFLGVGLKLAAHPDRTGAAGICFIFCGLILLWLGIGTVRNFYGKGA